MLYNIIIAPIEMLVDWVFSFFIVKIQLGVIGAIIGVSLVINILALPLYNIADAIQDKERKINKKLEYRTRRIKKAFKGDEQFMILSEYYRQNNYHPLYVLRSATSLLIQIPFFIAAYNYLSASEILKDSSFWIFQNLGAPDALIKFEMGGGIACINILPIVMTVINFISGAIYTKDATLRDKIQLYGLGLFFLILLYNSPSGLVIYWIMNNLFSLGKNIVMKTKHPGLVLHGICSAGLFAVDAFFFLRGRRVLLVGEFFVLSLLFAAFPYVIIKIKRSIPPKGKTKEFNNRETFFLVLFCGLALALLCGFLLPSQTISSSPIEFAYIEDVDNPSAFVWDTLWVYVGLFVFWPVAIYAMFGPKVRRGEGAVLFALLTTALMDAFVFKGDYGTLSAQFFLIGSYDLDPHSIIMLLGPFAVFGVAFILFFILNRIGKESIITIASLSVVIGEIILGGVNVSKINEIFTQYDESKKKMDSSFVSEEIEPVFHFSKDGNNVVVVFLDRAIGEFFPHALEEEPQLKQQFEGFTFYPNTVSHGISTDVAYPSMIAGYEYTPEKINARESELLREKHNEALLVMPTLFEDAGYNVTIADPSLPNYSWRGDLSAFDALEKAEVLELYSRFRDDFCRETGAALFGNDVLKITKNGARNFSALQVLPPVLRRIFYSFGWWNLKEEYGEYVTFVDSISSLYFLNELSDVDNDDNNYIYIGNDATHSPSYLDETYIHGRNKETAGEVSLFSLEEKDSYQHYQVFISSMLRLGKWFDWMRENGIYDNTRIIVVADHGYSVAIEGELSAELTYFNPLLLYKDYGERGEIKMDNEFMTNADTIFLATDRLKEISRVNPFTGEELRQEKNAVKVWKTYGNEYDVLQMLNKTQFTLKPENGLVVVGDNIFSESSWMRREEYDRSEK